MSSPTNPPLSPFVRGTTDTKSVFFLQPPSRRLIPDDETLNFMLEGQTVRVLSDAGLAAIPLGSPLPSRKNGTLIQQHFTSPPPAVTVYLMTGGQRRQSPDLATTIILTKSLPVVSVELADLNAIPQGPLLPSRADNTLYQGTGTSFAYILTSGAKRAFPDATTLRDAGHDFHALLPISAVDAALIPDGAPFPTTSRFLSPPSSVTPLVLLPVRLEIRFQGTELWLRVFPDDIHVNSFEPQLTSDEQAARADFLNQAKSGQDAARTAFGSLARQFGPARAAWIASANVPTATKSSQWTTAPFTNMLPERWIVLGYQGAGAGTVLAVGPAIPESVQVAPAPSSAGPLSDPGLKWLTDFNTAIQVGMAFRITLTPAQQKGFTRIVVLGLKTSLPAADAAARLGDLVQAHHYTDGFELLALNTPTNNTEDISSGFSTTQINYDAVFALEQGPSLCPSRPTADGDRLAAALNIPPALLSQIGGADGRQDEIGTAINTVMWPATWGYYLSQMVNGSVPNPDAMLPAARDHFIAEVRARGHFPILRVGKQPYGLLPVVWSAQWQPLEGRVLDAPLEGLLAKMRTTWENSISNVPRIPGTADPDASLAALLGMTASSNSFFARNVIGPEYNFSYWNFVQKDLTKTWWTTLAEKTTAGTTAVSTISNTRLASSAFVKQERSLTDILITQAPLDGLPAPAYIAQLAALGWVALRDVPLPSAPIPLFFLLLRHAALRQYLDSALDLLTASNAAQPAERIEAELLGFSTAVRPTAWDLLNRALGSTSVGTFLDNSKTSASVPAFAAFWTAFNQLSNFSAAELDAAIREVFDLGSYRLDAWISSFAHFRLKSLRAASPNGGIVLGGYGWLENVFPQPAQTSAGFIHAPSLNQSTTAAVLRAGYLAHNNGAAARPFQVDLSSGKVRLATHLLDGVREGQPLGALLGYRLERTLHDLSLDPFIAPLRTIAPMQSATNTLDVVDGIVLLQKFQDPNFWNLPGLPASGTTQRTQLTDAINRLSDAVSAVGDLTLAESVHQLIRGNVVRAGATLDSIARGDTPPPEIDIINTPRAGTALTYRLMAIAPTANTASGWTTTPRAQAEPHLNAWAAAILGDPKLVRIRVSYLNAQSQNISTVEFGLDQLALAPLDVLSFPEGLSQELIARIRRASWTTRPSGAVDIQILTDRDSAWSPQVVALTEWLSLAQALSRIVNASRPLLSADLVVQGDPPGTMNVADLKTRADNAESQLRAVLATLQKSSATDTDLMSAASFGLTDSVPDIDSTRWPTQITAAATEAAARVAQLGKLAAPSENAPSEQLVDFHSSRVKAIFGGPFQLLPLLQQGSTDLFAASASLQGNDPLESVRWFQRAARVRPGAQRLDTAVSCAEALTGQLLMKLTVAQLPSVSGDKWFALEGSTSMSRLSLVAFAPSAVIAAAPFAGLMIDEWTEVLPSAQQITGVSFQYTDPIARPPQSILLAVKPDDFPEWTSEAVEGSILEALDLAKIRAVDPDALGALGHYLPALYFAFNTGAPAVETVSTDFNMVLKAATEIS